MYIDRHWPTNCIVVCHYVAKEGRGVDEILVSEKIISVKCVGNWASRLAVLWFE